MNMLPSGTADNMVYRHLAKAKFVGQRSLSDGASGILSANCSHKFVREFRRAMLFTPGLGAVLNLVSKVSLPSVPAKIADYVVGWVAIVVTRFHSLGARSGERFKHKTMNVARVQSGTKYNNAVTTLCFAWAHLFPNGRENGMSCRSATSNLSAGPYATVVADAVAREAKDFFVAN